MRSLFTGSFLAALAMFAFGFLYWAGGIAELGASHLDAEAEQALRATIMQHVPATGVYTLPDMTNMDGFPMRHRAGPIAQLFITRAGAEPMAPMVFVLGFLHMWLSAVLLALLLRGAGSALPSYGSKIYAALAIGVLVALWGQVGDAIWFYNPWGYRLVAGAYDVIGFALMGAILARFVKS